jgi:hypothetical protein
MVTAQAFVVRLWSICDLQSQISSGTFCLVKCELLHLTSSNHSSLSLSLLIFSYSFDSKTFSLRNDFRIMCCIDRLNRQPQSDIGCFGEMR